MHYPHRIRLRGPWECEPLAPATPNAPPPPPRRLTMPCRSGPGRGRYRRRFGYPGRIDAPERVWLTFAGVDSSAYVRLDGQLLGHHVGAFEPIESEVTGLIHPRNEQVVQADSSG